MTPFGFRKEVTLTNRELEELDVPVEIVLGTGDPVGSEKYGRGLQRHLRTARLHMVAGGHMPWLESTERVASLLRNAIVGRSVEQAA